MLFCVVFKARGTQHTLAVCERWATQKTEKEHQPEGNIIFGQFLPLSLRLRTTKGTPHSLFVEIHSNLKIPLSSYLWIRAPVIFPQNSGPGHIRQKVLWTKVTLTIISFYSPAFLTYFSNHWSVSQRTCITESLALYEWPSNGSITNFTVTPWAFSAS